MPLLLLLPFALIAMFAVAVYLAVELPGWLRKRGVLEARQPRVLRSAAKNSPSPAKTLGGQPDDGTRRLADLEKQLEASLVDLGAQTSHLQQRREEIASKDGRAELSARYAEDVGLLEHRAARMQRVLGLLWKTRAILSLRARLAAAARARPELGALPDVDEPGVNLVAAEKSMANAAAKTRSFVHVLARAKTELRLVIPVRPAQATVTDAQAEEVEAEAERARAALDDLYARMDRLADTLEYLSDRARTRQVARAAPIMPDGRGAPDALLDELADGLAALDELAQTGDRKLDHLVVQNLAEDISQLEQVGLEAQAEADAALEIARLLEPR